MTKLRNMLIISILLMVLIGCGSSSDSNNKINYDLWSYMKSSDDIHTDYYDELTKDINNNVIDTKLNNSYSDFNETNTQINEIETSSSGITISTSTKNDFTINNTLDGVEDYDFKRFISINDKIANIKIKNSTVTIDVVFTNYYKSFKIDDGYQVYNDVIELKFIINYEDSTTDVIKDYLAKNIGYIGMIDKNCFIKDNTTQGYHLDDSQDSCTDTMQTTYEMKNN